jgi:hypothetical protein
MKLYRLIAIAILLLNWTALANEVHTSTKEIITKNDRIEAKGRWVETARLNAKAPLIPKLNSVEIVCDRAKGICHEAIASLFTKDDVPQLSGQLLMAVITEYKILRWDASGITAKAAKPVADEEIKINIETKTVTRRHRETKARGSQTANPNLVIEWELR